MIDLRLLLAIVAILCFLLAALGIVSNYVALVPLGLAFLALAWVLPHRRV